MTTLTITPTVTVVPTTTILDELEYRSYVSHRIRDISFERMVAWKFWHDIKEMERRYQAALDEEQAIEIYPEYNHSLRVGDFSGFSLED